MVLLDSTAVANQASQFGVFEKLTDYGALGLIVLALGYVSWMFVQKKLKENEELKKKIEDLSRQMYKFKSLAFKGEEFAKANPSLEIGY